MQNYITHYKIRTNLSYYGNVELIRDQKTSYSPYHRNFKIVFGNNAKLFLLNETLLVKMAGKCIHIHNITINNN